MMVINGLMESSRQMSQGSIGNGNNTDAVSKNLQKQIADAQKQLQELSSNSEMSVEEKMNKRQEIQKLINDLNNQLRQHQIELKKEKQQKNESSKENMLGEKQTEGNKNRNGQTVGLSQANMQAIISADATIKQAEVQGSTASKMEGRAGVLKAEIKQDAALGGNTEAKQKELAEVEKIADSAQTSQMKTLGDVNKQIQEAAQEGQSEGKVENKEKKDGETELENQDIDLGKDTVVEDAETIQKAAITYNPIDILL